MSRTPSEIAHRLVEARKAWGLSQAELAQRAGLDVAEVMRAEKTARVEVSVVASMARELGGSLDDVLRGTHFWGAPALALKSAEPGLQIGSVRTAIVRLSCARSALMELRELLGAPDFWSNGGAELGPVAVGDDFVKQAEQLAIKVRKALGNPNEAFLSVRSALGRLGIATFLSDFGWDEVDGTMWRPRNATPSVAANVASRGGLSTAIRMTFAHELCHALFDRPKEGDAGIVELRSDALSAQEKRANAFAAYFIAPRAAVDAALGAFGLGPDARPTSQHLLSLSERFGMGVEAMAWHFVNCRRWRPADVQAHRHLVTSRMDSVDDRELRADAAERAVPLERRGEVLDLATQALARGLISTARWRELLDLDVAGPWAEILYRRKVGPYAAPPAAG